MYSQSPTGHYQDPVDVAYPCFPVRGFETFCPTTSFGIQFTHSALDAFSFTILLYFAVFIQIHISY